MSCCKRADKQNLNKNEVVLISKEGQEINEKEKQEMFKKIQKQKLKDYEESKLYQKALQKEKQCLVQSELEYEKEIKVYNVEIELEDGTLEFIHTYNCGWKNKENLILLHGYAGSSMTYVKCLKELSKKYNVYAIDILGIGMSSRPKFTLTDPQEIINYFVHSVHQWVEKQGLKGKFHLAGHSFGGYISSFYSIQHPQNIKKLFLISPVGGTHYTEQEKQQQKEYYSKNAGKLKKFFLGKLEQIFKEKTGPTQLLSRWYIPTKYSIKRYFSKRVGLPDKEVNLWYEYMDVIFKMPESTEIGFFDLFKFPMVCPVKALEHELPVLKEKDFEIIFYYGDYDWMNIQGCMNLFSKKQINGQYKFIKNAGHQIVFENPQRLTEEMNSHIKEQQQQN